MEEMKYKKVSRWNTIIIIIYYMIYYNTLIKVTKLQLNNLNLTKE